MEPLPFVVGPDENRDTYGEEEPGEGTKEGPGDPNILLTKLLQKKEEVSSIP